MDGVGKTPTRGKGPKVRRIFYSKHFVLTRSAHSSLCLTIMATWPLFGKEGKLEILLGSGKFESFC